MKKVMKFVKGKRDEETPAKNIPVETKKIVNEKVDENSREDDFISRDKTITKLHKAVWNENSDKLKSIIKTHDIDITDKLDRTALYFAVLKNNPNIVNLLLENSANQNIPDIDGITPFLKSVQLGHKQCAVILLNYGADIKKTDKDLNSCLHFAIMGKQSDMLTFLLEHDADSNVSNVNGEYPLHIAIQMQDKETVELLLNYNVDINTVNNFGLTPYMVAEQLNNLEIVELLESYSLKSSRDNNLFPDEISHKSSYENVNTPKIEQRPSSKVDNDDTWNDSPITTPNKKKEKPPTKISKHFFNEETEIMEEKSESDISIKCSENTSPQSGIIPPPCKPLRSLEYLQSGLSIDNRPVHLLTLGTVRTRHISMTESDHSKNNTPHRYSYQGDFQAASGDSYPKITDHFSAADEKGDSVNISIKSKLLSKLECDSTIQSDWGSNESLPLDELSFGGKKEKSVTSSTSKNNSSSNSGSIKDKSTDIFLQKQFSLLEDYEKNREKRCSVSYEMDLLNVKVDKDKNNSGRHLDDIGNLLEDNNRINAQLEKYAGQSDSLVRITKSKSLPRNCEPYNNYHKGSFSLPRTLESGKDPFREMRSCGYFKPRSHFSFSLKMLKGDKKSGFIDKLKSMFNKKSQIHLSHQSDNGTWLYKKTDNEYYSSKLDSSFSGSENSKSPQDKNDLPVSNTLNNFNEFEEDSIYEDPSFSNNEQNKVIEKKILYLNTMSQNNMECECKLGNKPNFQEDVKQKFHDVQEKHYDLGQNFEGLEHKSNNAEKKYVDVKTENNDAHQKSDDIEDKYNDAEQISDNTEHTCATNKKSDSLSAIETILCDECSEFLNQKLIEATETVLSKQQLISLLQSQLEQLKYRNIKSINDRQDLEYKFGVAQQEIVSLKHICIKYDEELQKFRTEKVDRDQSSNQDELVEKLREETEKWKKQYEELMIKVNFAKGEGKDEVSDEEEWRKIIKNEVQTAVGILKENSQTVISALEKQNQKLETMVEKQQQELNASCIRDEKLQLEIEELKRKLAKSSHKTDSGIIYDDTVTTLQNNNAQLQAELNRINQLYSALQQHYDLNMKKIEQEHKSSVEIKEELNIVKEEYRAITKSLSSLSEEIVKTKENALAKNEELRQRIVEMGPGTNMKEFISKITESLETIENSSPDANSRSDSIGDVSDQINILNTSISDVEKINKINSEIEIKILEVKYGKKISSLEEENKEIKKKMMQQCSSLMDNIKETNEEIIILNAELKSQTDAIRIQSEQIDNLNDIIENEKQKNDVLESEISSLRKSKGEQLSKEVEQLKIELTSLYERKSIIKEENLNIRKSFSDVEILNGDLQEKLKGALATLNEMKNVIEIKSKKIEILEKSNHEFKNTIDILQNLKHDDSTMQNYDDKMNKLIEEKNLLKQKLEIDQESIMSLKKHIESLQFYHENEMKANNEKIKELQNENKSNKFDFETVIETLMHKNCLLEENVYSIKTENVNLQKNLDMLTEGIHSLQNVDIKKYSETIESLNRENVELKNAMNNLREILELKLGGKVSNEILEASSGKEVKVISSVDFEVEKERTPSKICRFKEIQPLKYSDSDKSLVDVELDDMQLLITKVNDIEKRIDELVDDVSIISDGAKSISLPNLEEPGANTVSVPPSERKVAILKRSSSLDCAIANPDIDENDCFKQAWEKRMESVTQLRNELTDILHKIDSIEMFSAIKLPEDNSLCHLNKCARLSDVQNVTVLEKILKQNKEMGEEKISAIDFSNKGSLLCHLNKCTSLADTQETAIEIKKKTRQNIDLQEKEKDLRDQTPAFEDELYNLGKELYKQRVERIKEIAKIQKDANVFVVRQYLNYQYLESKKKLLLLLNTVQRALQVKNEEGIKLKQNCDELVKEVTANQEARKIKLNNISSLTSQSTSMVKKILMQKFPCTSHQESFPSGGGDFQKPIKPRSLATKAKVTFNTTVEKHCVNTESVPEQSNFD